jgi:hypothetical protein
VETILIQGTAVPIAPALDAGGHPVDLIGDIESWGCDHKGQMWSDCLDLRCVRCGARLFMPGRFLALRSAEVIETMHAAWVRAGWPGMTGGAWCIRSDMWTILQDPLFAHVGGLPVRNDRLADFATVAARADRPQLEERPV